MLTFVKIVYLDRCMVSFLDTERKIGVSAESIQRSNLARTVKNLKFYLGRNYDEVCRMLLC